MDAILHIIFRLTGSRHVSDLISERRVERRWQEAARAHKADGGVVATYESSAGSQSFLIGSAGK